MLKELHGERGSPVKGGRGDLNLLQVFPFTQEEAEAEVEEETYIRFLYTQGQGAAELNSELTALQSQRG